MNLKTAISLFLTGLALATANAQRVGASLSLEGRTAVLRGADVLLSAQNKEGLWQNSWELTAISACALHAVLPYSEDKRAELAVGKALATLRPQLKDMRAAQLAQAVRLPLLVRDEGDDKLLDGLRNQLEASGPASVWKADAILLLAQRLQRKPTMASLRNLAAAKTTARAQQLALAIMTQSANEEALKTLYSQVRRQSCQEISMEDLYWAARSFQACNKAKLIPYDGWKADMMSALLDRQRGNGTWAAKIPDFMARPSPDDLRNTALAIHTAILCLMD